MKKFNPNWIGLALVIGAFSYSAVRFGRIALQLSQEDGSTQGKKVIRVLHWQLEPGYREGMDDVIRTYNQLPHVVENNVEVRQLAVTERVYAQFINVHLISGTAPDIVTRGMSSLVGTGASTARFFTPISRHIDQPNPYNAPEYLPEDLSPELKAFLPNAPWSETFTDGMLGGWDDILQDYYSVPVSSWGAMRVFYNRELVAEIKQHLAEALGTSPLPPWLSTLITNNRIVPLDEPLLQWARTPDVPDTLGRFILFNETVRNVTASTPGRELLVPISASSYFAGTMVDRYLLPFTYHLGEQVDFNRDSVVNGQEVLAGLQAGTWDFQNPALKNGFFDVVSWLAKYYPTGFLGLDREQAVRRFLNEQAVFIASGGWDAPTLFQGAKGRFTVGVTKAPMPAEGERWFEYFNGAPNEAETRLGVPLAIYNRSRNPDWALDFLKYLSSFEANQRMNVRAGWVPSVVGSRPDESMLPFLPDTKGLKGSIALFLQSLPTVGHIYNGQFPLLQNGEISYESFVNTILEGYANERNGINRMWYESHIFSQDRARSNERSLATVHVEAMNSDITSPSLRSKHLNLLETSLRNLDGALYSALFEHLFDDETFPEF